MDGTARAGRARTVAPGRASRSRAPWIVVAALTCPCHLPIYAAVLSGTALGALLSEHAMIAAGALGAAFLASLAVALGGRRDRSGGAG